MLLNNYGIAYMYLQQNTFGIAQVGFFGTYFIYPEHFLFLVSIYLSIEIKVVVAALFKQENMATEGSEFMLKYPQNVGLTACLYSDLSADYKPVVNELNH